MTYKLLLLNQPPNHFLFFLNNQIKVKQESILMLCFSLNKTLNVFHNARSLSFHQGV